MQEWSAERRHAVGSTTGWPSSSDSGPGARVGTGRSAVSTAQIIACVYLLSRKPRAAGCAVPVKYAVWVVGKGGRQVAQVV